MPGFPQFQVIGMIVETSYQGDDNKVKVGAGSVEVLNWAPLTKTRYEIDKMICEGDVRPAPHVDIPGDHHHPAR